MKRLSRLGVGPGEAEPFDRCTSRVTAADTIRRGRALYLRASKAHASQHVRRNPTIGNRQPANHPSITHLGFYTGGKATSRFPSISGSDPTKTHSAHCCACTLSAKAGAGHEVRASGNFRAAPRPEDQLSFWNGGAFHACLKLETRMPTCNVAPPSRFRLLGFERSHIDREAVPHIGLEQSFVGFVDPLDGDDFDIGGNVMRAAKVPDFTSASLNIPRASGAAAC